MGFWWSLYFSLEVLTSLGLGDITPTPMWLRLLVTTHTLVGFSLITASVTWIVLLYPALGALRTLARRTAALADAERISSISVLAPHSAHILTELAEAVARTRVDLVHFPVIFYFHSEDPRASLPRALPLLEQWALAGAGSDHHDAVRLAASNLGVALDDLANLLAARFLETGDEDRGAVFTDFAKLHREAGSSVTSGRARGSYKYHG